MVRRDKRISLIAVLLTALFVVSCSGGGGGGGDPVTCVDIAGVWTSSENVTSNSCGGSSSPSVNTYTITQNACSVSATSANGGSYTGTVNGSTVSLSGSHPQYTGTVTVTPMTLTVSADGNSMSGTADWTLTDTGVNCTGTSSITAAKNGNSGGSTSPSAPAGVAATPGNQQVTVSWQSVSGATSYKVYRSTSPGVTKTSPYYSTLITSFTGTLSMTQKFLTNSTPYYFVVTARNSSNLESAVSSEVSATPLASFTPPATPGSVSAASGPSAGEVAVTMSGSTGATRYCAYYSTTPGTMTTYASLQGNPSTCTTYIPVTVSGLTSGVTYYFVATAWSLDGESAPSPEVSAAAL